MHPRASPSSPGRRGRRKDPIGHLETQSLTLSPGRLHRAPTDPQKSLSAQLSHWRAYMRDLTIGEHCRATSHSGQCPERPRPPLRPQHHDRHGLGKLFPSPIGRQHRHRGSPASSPPARAPPREKQGKLPSPATRECTRCTWTAPERRRVDSVHRRPVYGPWTSVSWSTVSHAHAPSRRPQPSGGPRLRRGSTTACHVSGPARPRSAQPEPTKARLRPGPC